MKLRFLDKLNCHALLPPGHGLPVVQRLEECLAGINDNNNVFKGLIDDLIRHNKKTKKKRRGSERLMLVPLDIAQGLNIADRSIHTQALERPEPSPLYLHTVLEYPNGISWKTVVPLQFLLKDWGNANKGHQCYVHCISNNMQRRGSINDLISRQMQDKDDLYYVGITGRNWLLRLGEHLGEVHRGGMKWFHQALRDNIGKENVLISSWLEDVNLSKDDAYMWEEMTVDKIASDSQGLNMIPGGYKGLKFLHEHRLIKNLDVSVEERDRAIVKYHIENPRKGKPNPFIADLWKNDEYYLRNISAREKTLSMEQVKRIRELHEAGWSIQDITKEVNALNETQVKNVIDGKTYQRMH